MPQKTRTCTLPAEKEGKTSWPEAISPNRRISPFDFKTGKGHPRFLFIIEGERIVKINFGEAITWSPKEGFMRYISMSDASDETYHVSRSQPCVFNISLFRDQLVDARKLDPELDRFIERHPEVLTDK